MLIYVYKTVIFQMVFLLFYEILLKKSTFFNWNRAYLLLTLFFSLLLPFIDIETPFNNYSFSKHIVLPEVFIGAIEVNHIASATDGIVQVSENKQSFSTPLIIFSIVSLSLFVYLIYKLWKIFDLKNKNYNYKFGKLLIIRPQHQGSPFSFFNMIFINKNISKEAFETILKHELVHVKQKHSYDLILLSILKILFWFNPLIYFYKNRLELTHEFIADRHSTTNKNRKTYINLLLNQVFETQHINFINSYYKSSLMKHRIKMLQSLTTNRTHLFRFLLLIPLILGCLFFTSSKVNAQIESSNKINTQQEISEDELVKKYYNQYVAIGDFGEIFESSGDVLKSLKTKYKISFDDHCKIKAVFLFLNNQTKKRKSEEGTWTNEDETKYKKRLKKSKNYDEYLAYSKTLESKLNWESRTNDGVLRLVVDDIKNFTEEEQVRYDKKMKMMENDEFFTGLRICQTDGKAKTFFGEEKEAKEVKYLNTDTVEVPFAVIEEAPTTKDCKDASFEERKKCLSDFIAKFVATNLNINIAKEKGLTGRQRISVGFKIDKNGRVIDILTRAPHPALENETKRVINLLPQFVPGKQKGKTVVVPYSLPIVFEVK